MSRSASWARAVHRFLARESGATAVEYAVLLALLLGVCLAAAAAFLPLAGQHFGNTGGVVGTYEDP
jgi:Flp pilus assembly pilin Flp